MAPPKDSPRGWGLRLQLEEKIKMRAPQSSSDPAELLETAVIEDPHPFFARVREEHPVSRVGETGVHLVANWEGILEVLDREEDFSANLTGVLMRGEGGQPSTFDLPPAEGTQVIATADEPRHTVHRRLVRPRMTEKRIALIETNIRRWCSEALEHWLEAGGGDFAPISEIVPARAIGHLLGLPDGDAERHRTWALLGGEMLAGDVDLARIGNLAAETAPMGSYIAHHLKEALSNGEPANQASLLNLLAAGRESGEINTSEAIGIAIVMFGAGGESTSALIGSAVRLLAQDPDLAEFLRRNLELVPRFIEEALRLEPPFKFHYRAVRRECELAGYPLEPGDRLMLLWAAANRDPSVFDAPDEMKLDRKHPKHHMSFGRGTHFCAGTHLARLEARIMIEDVLRGTEHFTLNPESPPVHARSIFIRRLEHLPIVVG